MPAVDGRVSRWRSALDERSAAGGRLKAWLFLTHPGPSLLVTALVVGAAALLARRAPDIHLGLGLVLLMLPAQLAIGALNDWADVGLDSAEKPFKPIPRGMVARRAALGFAIGSFALSLVAAAWLGPALLGVDVVVVAAGAGYDLALKRTPGAVLAWWAGFIAVPLAAMAATGRPRGAAAVVPLAGLLALALLLANGLPDAEGDRRAGATTLPVVLGVDGSHLLMSLSLGIAAVYTLVVRAALGQGWGALATAALLGAGTLLTLWRRRPGRLVFPLLALLVAAATVSWLAALPAPG